MAAHPDSYQGQIHGDPASESVCLSHCVRLRGGEEMSSKKLRDSSNRLHRVKKSLESGKRIGVLTDFCQENMKQRKEGERLHVSDSQ